VRLLEQLVGVREVLDELVVQPAVARSRRGSVETFAVIVLLLSCDGPPGLGAGRAGGCWSGGLRLLVASGALGGDLVGQPSWLSVCPPLGRLAVSRNSTVSATILWRRRELPS